MKKFNHMKKITMTGICMILTAGIMLYSCSKKETTTFTLGVITNFEGVNSQSSIDASNSITLAYQELLQQYPGSVKIDILAIDNSDDPEKTKTAYQTIKDKCDFFMVITTSTAFLAIYDEVVKQNDKLHFVVGPTTTVISDKDDNVLRNGVDMIQEQKSIAGFIQRKNADNVLVIQENEKNVGYTGAALKVFSSAYEGNIEHTGFSAVTTDFTQVLNKIAEENFDYVYILAGGTPREVGILIQQIHDIKPEIYIVTTPWVRGPFLIEAIGKNTERVIVPGHVSTGNEAYMQYADKFKLMYNYPPAFQAPLTYDAAKILLEAVFNVKKTNTADLKQYILARTFTGTTGEIKFNAFGDVDGDLFFYAIKDNVYEVMD